MRVRPFLTGVLCGGAALVAAGAIVDATDWVDLLVAPLLLPDSTATAEAIIVPGAGVLGPRCEPNLSALRRTMAAARLYREGRAPLVVFTGGAPAGDENCVVSTTMAEFAVQLGLPREALLVETRSHSTHENALFTRELLAARGVRRVLLVTDALHVRRAAACFRRAGFAVVTVSVPAMLVYPSNVGMLRMGAHEYLALSYYRLRGYL